MHTQIPLLYKCILPNTVVTFVGLIYIPTCRVPCAIVNYNGINFIINPWELVKLFEVSSFEELEDVYKHTKVLYKGFTTSEKMIKEGFYRTVVTYKFEKI